MRIDLSGELRHFWFFERRGCSRILTSRLLERENLLGELRIALGSFGGSNFVEVFVLGGSSIFLRYAGGVVAHFVYAGRRRRIGCCGMCLVGHGEGFWDRELKYWQTGSWELFAVISGHHWRGVAIMAREIRVENAESE